MGGVAAIAGPLIGSVAGGLFGQSAAGTQAAGAQNAAQIAANAQLQGLQLVQKQEQPYTQAGAQALGQYQNLLGGGAANFDISKLPGYSFEMQEGTSAIENSAAARGTSLSGNTLESLQQYGQGLASTQFQNYMSQLAGLTNLGQAAASGVANQGAQLLSGAGASLAGGVNAAANANAAGIANWGNAVNQGISNYQTVNSPVNQWANQQMLGSLFPGSGLGTGGMTYNPSFLGMGGGYNYTNPASVGPPVSAAGGGDYALNM